MNAFNNLDERQKQGLLVGAMIGLAIFVTLAAILMSGGSAKGTGIDYTGDLGDIEMWRLEDGGHVIGNPDAPVTIVLFEDFTCPYCQAYKSTVNRIFEELVMTGKAKFEFRFIPTHGPLGEYAFQLAECAGDLIDGGFWVAHDELFAVTSAKGDSVTQDDLRTALTDRLDISAADLIACTRDANQSEADKRLAQRFNISSTPSVRMRYGDNSDLQTVSSTEFDAIVAAVELANSGIIPSGG